MYMYITSVSVFWDKFLSLGRPAKHTHSFPSQFRSILVKMKLALLSSLVAGAAAFAPAQQGASSTALKAFESELGVQPPLGFFDPLGLLTNADQERFERLRYVELKHGRICQLVSRVSCVAAYVDWICVGVDGMLR